MLKALILLVVGTIFGACLFTPAVYSTLLFLFPNLSWPFSRVYDRVVMVCAVILLLLFRREFSLERLKEYYQRESWDKRIRYILCGIFVSLLVTLAFLPLVVGDKLAWASPLELRTSKLIKLVPAAILISLIEESFFRVLLFNKLRENFSALMAAFLASVVYAVAHFITPVRSYSYPGFSLFGGFEYFAEVSGRLFLPGIASGIVGLTLVGLVLCYALYKTGSVYLCIGLHAGWVVAVKLSLYLTQIVEGAQFPEGIGRRYFLISVPYGWLSVAVVFAILVAANFVLERSRSNTAYEPAH